MLYANTDSGESLVPVVTSYVTGERLIGGREQGYDTYSEVMAFIGALMDEYHAR
ncbi:MULTISPECIES: hypothetical protein [unclassified Vibrio]|uniref:hypothetical protein n=1 Tax=unclassified Vibrio TaxID=2614977 RepID=UPI0035500C2C